jgi:tRNA-dihydrouridine synthase A
MDENHPHQHPASLPGVPAAMQDRTSAPAAAVQPAGPAAGAPVSPWRLCIAPMLDWTDRHCRSFHRLLSPHARLYTEMVTTGALLHGDIARHLDFDAGEHPVALQLGGSDPADLAHCARLGAQWGYDEINLNCGCPSERVQRGAFGACLMAEPRLVADCVHAMREAVDIPVTIKQRIGVDRTEDYGFVRDFVGANFEAGCRVFIVHARNAWLKGLSPKENRELPPLRYEVVRQLKQDFPAATFVLNGGLATPAQACAGLEGVDGVMVGRLAYHQPGLLPALDAALFGAPQPDDAQHAAAIAAAESAALIERISAYLEQAVARGATPWSVIRHTLGLFHGSPGARAWRRSLSDPDFIAAHGINALRAAAPRRAAVNEG